MIFTAALAALRRLPSPEFRSVLWKSLGLTLIGLIALWLILREVFLALAWPTLSQLLPAIPDWAGWIGLVAAIFAGLGLALALALLIAPVTALIASLFLDDVAQIIETEDYSSDPAGTAMPLGRSLIYSIKFLFIVLLGNLIALLLLLVPGVNLIAFFVINGYLLGREFFEFAAMRFRSEQEAKDFRSRHRLTVFLAGLLIAAFLSIPLVNLLTPLFAAAFMVHLHKLLSAADQKRSHITPAL